MRTIKKDFTTNDSGKILGTLEKEIMEVVWASDHPISVKESWETIKNKKKQKVAYTTVMTIMGRLVTKGLLKKTITGKAHYYSSTYTKERFLSKVSHQIIKNFTSSFGEAAIAHFVDEVEKIPLEKKAKLVKLLKE